MCAAVRYGRRYAHGRGLDDEGQFPEDVRVTVSVAIEHMHGIGLKPPDIRAWQVLSEYMLARAAEVPFSYNICVKSACVY